MVSQHTATFFATLCCFATSLCFATPSVAQDAVPDPTKDPLSGPSNPTRRDAMGLMPKLTGAELHARAEEAYQRGFDFLVGTQNKDGSWGSHDPRIPNLKDFGFRQGNRGSQDGVRAACTAIIGKALLGKLKLNGELNPAEEAALSKAIDELVRTEKFAYHLGEAFNTWGYGFKLDFLCDYLETERGAADHERVVPAAEVCVEGLKRFQQADGGWNYYAGAMMGGESMSFNTSNFAEALYRARQLGIRVPEGMIHDAVSLLKRMRTARGGVVYDARFLNSAREVNVLSQASRTAAWAEALSEIEGLDPATLTRCLMVFDEGENWLEDGRKLIQPHTAVHQVSGYFYFYGYHYLSEFLRRMGARAPRSRWERNAWTMMRTQEDDGRWWDTAAGDYGDKWGTGFALLVLQRYFENCPVEEAPVLGGER